MADRHNIFVLTKRLERLEEDQVKLLQQINSLLARVETLEQQTDVVRPPWLGHRKA
jgi:prefoldin subunit 5